MLFRAKGLLLDEDDPPPDQGLDRGVSALDMVQRYGKVGLGEVFPSGRAQDEMVRSQDVLVPVGDDGLEIQLGEEVCKDLVAVRDEGPSVRGDAVVEERGDLRDTDTAFEDRDGIDGFRQDFQGIGVQVALEVDMPGFHVEVLLEHELLHAADETYSVRGLRPVLPDQILTRSQE